MLRSSVSVTLNVMVTKSFWQWTLEAWAMFLTYAELLRFVS